MEEKTAIKTEGFDTDKEQTVETKKTCTNCGHELEHNFCPNCGQMRYRRIDGSYVIAEVLNVLSATTGLLYSVKKLVRNPGGTAREFIEGHRINHYRPLYLVFILSGINVLITSQLIDMDKVAKNYYTGLQSPGSDLSFKVSTFIMNYYSLFMVLCLPIMAIFTWFAFRKWGQNYYEHIIMNAYFISLYTVVALVVSTPLIYFLRGQTDTIMTVSFLSNLIILPLLLWFYKGFYSEKPFDVVLGRYVWSLVLLFLAAFLFMFLSIAFGFVYAMITHG